MYLTSFGAQYFLYRYVLFKKSQPESNNAQWCHCYNLKCCLIMLLVVRITFNAEKFGEFYKSGDYVLESLNQMYDIKTAPPSPPEQRLQSWQDYVTWRGLDADSPAAMLMQWPLTLYHVICNVYRKQSLCLFLTRS